MTSLRCIYFLNHCLIKREIVKVAILLSMIHCKLNFINFCDIFYYLIFIQIDIQIYETINVRRVDS